MRTAAVSAREYHLHLINACARDLFPYVLYCAMSQLLASDQFVEQKTSTFDSMKRLITTFDTSASQILLEEVDLIAYR